MGFDARAVTVQGRSLDRLAAAAQQAAGARFGQVPVAQLGNRHFRAGGGLGFGGIAAVGDLRQGGLRALARFSRGDRSDAGQREPARRAGGVAILHDVGADAGRHDADAEAFQCAVAFIP